MTVSTSPAHQGVPVLRTYLELNPDHPLTRGMILSAHSGHRATMSLFARVLADNDFFTGRETGKHPNHRSTNNLLWAINCTRAPHRSLDEFAPRPRVRVILQSDQRPCFDAGVSSDADQVLEALITEPDVRRYVPDTTAGRVIEYQVVVNPRHHARRNGKSHIVIARTEAQIMDWWVRKSQAAGISLVADPMIDEPGTRRLHKRSSDPGKDDIETDINHVRITGKAMITDSAAYATAAHTGIGAARSYGCGLLLTR